MERQRCIYQMVQTLIHVCKTSSQIEAPLIVDGNDLAVCEQLVHQSGLADHIYCQGRLPPEQVQPLV